MNNDPLSLALGIEPMENPTYMLPFTKEELEQSRNITIPGLKHCEETKHQISTSNREYYKSPLGVLRRQKLSQWNSFVKSEELSKRWSDNYQLIHSYTKMGGRKKGSLDKGKRKKRVSVRRITDGVNVFVDADEASAYYNVHPVNIRRKCRRKIDSWRYL